MTSKFIFGFILFSAVGISQEGPNVRISGRVIDLQGKPTLRSVLFAPLESGSFRLEKEVITDQRGFFNVIVSAGKMYRIWFGRNYKTVPKLVDAIAGSDFDLGDLVFENCPAPDSKIVNPPASTVSGRIDFMLDQIIFAPLKVSGGKWNGIRTHEPSIPRERHMDMVEEEYPQCHMGAFSLVRRSEWDTRCNVNFGSDVSLESFIGGKVKSIRVINYEPQLTPDKIRAELKKVWLGVFSDVTCSINWAEYTTWNVEAVVEYEDGGNSFIVTDGGHVEVRDREGKYWYLRQS